jgi:hypothetical protein
VIEPVLIKEFPSFYGNWRIIFRFSRALDSIANRMGAFNILRIYKIHSYMCMWYNANIMSIEVSEEHVASIFRVKEYGKQETSLFFNCSSLFFAWITAAPSFRVYVPSKCLLTFKVLHWVISQKAKVFILILFFHPPLWGHAVAYWLKCNATSRKAASSRPDEVNEIINLPNPSGSIRPWGLLSL